MFGFASAADSLMADGSRQKKTLYSQHNTLAMLCASATEATAKSSTYVDH